MASLIRNIRYSWLPSLKRWFLKKFYSTEDLFYAYKKREFDEFIKEGQVVLFTGCEGIEEFYVMYKTEYSARLYSVKTGDSGLPMDSYSALYSEIICIVRTEEPEVFNSIKKKIEEIRKENNYGTNSFIS